MNTTAGGTSSPSSDGSGGSRRQSYGSRIRPLHNLMNALTAEVKRIGNLAQAHPALAHLKNLAVAWVVRCRARLQRAPLPTRHRVKARDTVGRKHALLVTLTNVAHPGTDRHFPATHDLYVESGAPGMAFALSELLNGLDVQIESGVVVHGRSLEHLYIACASEQIFSEVATRLTSWYGGGKESVRVRNQ